MRLRSTAPSLRKLPRTFYVQPTLRVAAKLIGKYLVRRSRTELLVGRIVEVEAYLGEKDPASHAYRGKTKRNEVMFWQGGHLYVYFTYGMHFCCNVVTEDEDIGHAVLLRAVEPVSGIDTMARNRGIRLDSEVQLTKLCSGPARLCQAFGIRREQNGTDLCSNDIWISENHSVTMKPAIERTARIGIRRGTEHKWRFILRGSRFISKSRPA